MVLCHSFQGWQTATGNPARESDPTTLSDSSDGFASPSCVKSAYFCLLRVAFVQTYWETMDLPTTASPSERGSEGSTAVEAEAHGPPPLSDAESEVPRAASDPGAQVGSYVRSFRGPESTPWFQPFGYKLVGELRHNLRVLQEPRSILLIGGAESGPFHRLSSKADNTTPLSDFVPPGITPYIIQVPEGWSETVREVLRQLAAIEYLSFGLFTGLTFLAMLSVVAYMFFNAGTFIEVYGTVTAVVAALAHAIKEILSSLQKMLDEGVVSQLSLPAVPVGPTFHVRPRRLVNCPGLLAGHHDGRADSRNHRVAISCVSLPP